MRGRIKGKEEIIYSILCKYYKAKAIKVVWSWCRGRKSNKTQTRNRHKYMGKKKI